MKKKTKTVMSISSQGSRSCHVTKERELLYREAVKVTTVDQNATRIKKTRISNMHSVLCYIALNTEQGFHLHNSIL